MQKLSFRVASLIYFHVSCTCVRFTFLFTRSNYSFLFP